MNIQLLDKIATWLEAGAPHTETNNMRFSMAVFYSELKRRTQGHCGSVGCIAGAAIEFTEPKILSGMGYDGSLMDHASKVLQLNQDSASLLFAPADYDPIIEHNNISHSDIDADWAARTIRHLIDTGEVDWVETAPEGMELEVYA